MRHKIKLLVVTALAMVTVGLHAENIFFPTKPGTVLVFAQKDGHGKITGYTRQTIKTVENSGENMIISFLYESMDEHQNPIVSVPCKVTIKDGVMVFDLKYAFVGKLKNAKEKINVTGTPVKFPTNLMPGQSIPDAHMVANVERSFVNVRVEVAMTDGKCVAIEDITVPSGTFNSHKISQALATTMMGSTNHSRLVSWGAPNVGIVRTDTYDDKNQLSSSVQLVEIK